MQGRRVEPRRGVHDRRGGVPRGVCERADDDLGRHLLLGPRRGQGRSRPGRASGQREGRGLGMASSDVKIVTKNFGVADSSRLGVALGRGAYRALGKALAMQPLAIVDEVKKSNLRGRGGAGFPTGMKWSFIPKDAREVYLVCNADESEPGTCKDRELLSSDPHLLIEGFLIAAYALRVRTGYIYIRGEMM